MNRLLCVALLLSSVPAVAGEPAAPAAAVAVDASKWLDKLKAMKGDWIDVDGTFGMKDQVAVTYRVTGNGTAVVETLFAGKPEEMMTVYHVDGKDLVLTHYCSGGNQPRMRAKSATATTIAFDYDGGTNVDPAKDFHMHSGKIELLGPDEATGEWQGWANGKAEGAHVAKFHIKRKK